MSHPILLRLAVIAEARLAVQSLVGDLTLVHEYEAEEKLAPLLPWLKAREVALEQAWQDHLAELEATS